MIIKEIQIVSKPIVFALANPTPEIFPDDAKKAGAYIIATGRSDFPNQITLLYFLVYLEKQLILEFLKYIRYENLC